MGVGHRRTRERTGVVLSNRGQWLRRGASTEALLGPSQLPDIEREETFKVIHGCPRPTVPAGRTVIAAKPLGGGGGPWRHRAPHDRSETRGRRGPGGALLVSTSTDFPI